MYQEYDDISILSECIDVKQITYLPENILTNAVSKYHCDVSYLSHSLTNITCFDIYWSLFETNIRKISCMFILRENPPCANQRSINAMQILMNKLYTT